LGIELGDSAIGWVDEIDAGATLGTRLGFVFGDAEGDSALDWALGEKLGCTRLGIWSGRELGDIALGITGIGSFGRVEGIAIGFNAAVGEVTGNPVGITEFEGSSDCVASVGNKTGLEVTDGSISVVGPGKSMDVGAPDKNGYTSDGPGEGTTLGLDADGGNNGVWAGSTAEGTSTGCEMSIGIIAGFDVTGDTITVTGTGDDGMVTDIGAGTGPVIGKDIVSDGIPDGIALGLDGVSSKTGTAAGVT
jgi:hypothetical protein